MDVARRSRGRPSKVTKPLTPQLQTTRRANRQALTTAVAQAIADEPNNETLSLPHNDDDSIVEAATPSTIYGMPGSKGNKRGYGKEEMPAMSAPPLLHTDTPIMMPVGEVTQQGTLLYPAPQLSGEAASSSAQEPPATELDAYEALETVVLSQQQLSEAHTEPSTPAVAMSPNQLPNPPVQSTFRTTEQVARESGYSELVVESALAKRLARVPGLRPAQQRRPDQLLNLSRRSNVEALFAYIAGEEVPSSCKNCHRGHGPWTACVVVGGQMCGSCANCWFNASGARCSFHETRNPPPQPAHTPHAHSHSNLPGAPGLSTAPGPSGHAYAMPMAPAIGTSFNPAASLALSDPSLGYLVEKAFAEVRTADKKARDLMMVEIAAKQLALSMLKYDEDHGSRVTGPSPPNPSHPMGGDAGVS